MDPKQSKDERLNVGLFVTCLVDLFRPVVGFATIKLLEDNGCQVHVPENQTCCGQPAWNSGNRADSAHIAKQVIAEFENFDYTVAPSGSCAAMIKLHYPEVLKTDKEWHDRALNLAAKTYEITQFLVDILHVEKIDGRLDKSVTYHDSCAGLRELKIVDQPRKLLSGIDKLELVEMKDSQVCCGFGGTFSVKYSQISDAIVGEKTENIEAAGTDLLLAGDLGCLINMAGKLKRQGKQTEVRHIAEVLAGMMDENPIAGKN